MVQHGILAIGRNAQAVAKYYQNCNDGDHDEALLLREFEALCYGQVNLKNVMTTGVTQYFGNNQNTIDYFGELYDEVKNNLLIYAPYSAEFSHSSIGASFFIDNSSDLSRIDIVSGQIVSEIVDQVDGPTSALWIAVYLNSVGENEVPGGGDRELPWHRCYCSRDSHWIDEYGNPHTSTVGVCDRTRKQENCGQCGRSNFQGECSGGSCPGC